MKTVSQKDVTFHEIVKRLQDAGCVFAEDEARLLISEALTASDLDAMADQRVAGFPLEQVIGWAEFYGYRIAVDHGVFVPRRRTEFLVSQASGIIRPGDITVDLCCGSGAVGAVLAKTEEGIHLYAADIDPIAVKCALRNVSDVGGFVYEGDLYDPLPSELFGHVHLIVANAPYVPSSAIKLLPSEAQDHEARVALDGGKDGHDIHRQIAAGASHWLAPGGHLLVETSERQALHTLKIFTQSGLISRIVRSSELDATVVIGAKSAE
ncbi:putative protein N(5)-glutamine methyltransferase [Bacillus sp. NEB1478]|uniref:putative protein N(5)-glutamine methyltransferase n=1 Tax=Bacillus sp. NEB1478 TaxID=3073816 RepID=UPI002873DE72|nr:putative protein N(5)-glutamine methyltransferase [Bacillus sp. NEB1478]WNB90901.1 putative protein N(5)-glutamine methyltransferase [Bacillus sp. NEB1478]